MIYGFVLVLHILIACGTGGVIAYALAALWRNREASYRVCALVLGLIAAAEVLTGTLLAFVSPTISAAGLSLHILEYLGACIAVEGFLFIRMHKVSLAFPLGLVASPVFASMVLFAAAMRGGF